MTFAQIKALKDPEPPPTTTKNTSSGVNKDSDISGVIASKNNRIMITSEGNIPVTGYLKDNFTISGSSEWTPFMEQSGAQEKIKKYLQAIKVSNGKGLSVDFPIQSRKTWSKSSIGDFTFNFAILALNNSDDVMYKVKTLLNGVFPQQSGKGNGRRFYPPNGYSAELQRVNPIGTWKVILGDRYIVIENLIMTSLEYSISRQKLPSGKPLFVEVTVTFQTVEDVSVDDVNSWFRS